MTTPTKSPLQKGEYHPAGPNDLRAPCPVLNSLANHGIIARDGRNITNAELKAAVRYLGLGPDVAVVLVNGAFQPHTDDPKDKEGSKFGLRDKNQVNKDGVPVLNLDQIGRPHAIEHDVSVTRQDREIGDYMHVNPDLLERFLNAPKQEKGFSSADFGRYRKTRYEEQKKENPQLDFKKAQHYIACAELGAIQGVFGKGLFSYHVPVEYIRALFGEERLPYNEGWKPRWTPLLFPEIGVVILTISHYAWLF